MTIEADIDREEIKKFFADEEKWYTILPVHATYFDWFCVLGSLQLALRHPENNGPSTDIVRQIAKQIAEYLMQEISEITPEFVELAKWEEFGIDLKEIISDQREET